MAGARQQETVTEKRIRDRVLRLVLIGSGLIAVSLAVLLPAAVSVAQVVSFGPATNLAVGMNPLSVAIGDLNGDGTPDLAAANASSNTVSVLLGSGAGAFGPATNLAVGTTPYSVAIGDLNGDGAPDLVVANANSHNVSILLGTGAGVFGAATNTAVGTTPLSVAIGDLNGDSRPDLAVANYGSGTVSILLGTGAFGLATNVAVGTNPYFVAIGNFNGDGRPDLAVANAGSYTVSILLGTGGGVFGAATSMAVGTSPRAVAIGDLNGDGQSDLAVANYGSDSLSILLGAGTGAFVAAPNVAVGMNPYSVAIGDFDGDGRPDLAVANYGSGTVSVLLGDGTGAFGAATAFAVGTYPRAVAAEDFNGDGRPDLAVANANSNTVSTLLNRTSVVTVTLSVSKAGTGGGTVTSSPAGINCVSTCSALFDSGTVVTLTATPGATSTFTGWSGACTGTGTCVVTMDAAKSVTSTFTATASSSKLINISARAFVGTGSDAAVGGFIISGTGIKQVLIRGFGPTLTSFGVTGALANPTLELSWDDDGNRLTPPLQLAVNDDWGAPAAVCTAPVVACDTPQNITNTGMSADTYAPTNPNRGLDAALLVTLPPGLYTVALSGVSNGTGVGLIGVDDVDTTQTATLVNVSTRAFVGTNADAAVGGFIISGTSAKTVLLRGFGPTLSSFGVTGALANPTLELSWDDDGNPLTSPLQLAVNNDWGAAAAPCNAPVVACGTSQDIIDTGMSADTYAAGDPQNIRELDAALLVTLPPGVYTVALSGVSNGTGVGLIGIDEVGP